MVSVRTLPRKGVKLKPGQRFVLYALADYADDRGVCWPSYQTLSEWTGFDRRTIIRSIAELEQAGLLYVEHQVRDNGSATSNRYRVLCVDPSWQQGVVSKSHYLVSESHQGGDKMSPLELPIELPKNLPNKNQELMHVQNAKNESTRSMSAKPTSVSNEYLLNLWNEHCDPLPRVTRLNGKRSSALNQLRRELGVEVEEIFCAAVLQVAGDAYWVENGYGFDNLLRNGRVLEKAEKYKAHGRSTSGQRRMVTTAMRIAAAIGGTDA
jgi:hypothetical protein